MAFALSEPVEGATPRPTRASRRPPPPPPPSGSEAGPTARLLVQRAEARHVDRPDVHGGAAVEDEAGAVQQAAVAGQAGQAHGLAGRHRRRVHLCRAHRAPRLRAAARREQHHQGWCCFARAARGGATRRRRRDREQDRRQWQAPEQLTL